MRLSVSSINSIARVTLAGMSEPLIETRQTYDAISETYARVTGPYEPPLMSDLTQLPAGALVADVGCGPGRDIVSLRAKGMRVVGFDLSFGQLRTGGLSGVAQADMRLLPVRTGSVDAVWCQAALLHIPREFAPAVLGEFGRVVRAGGQLFLHVAEGDGEGWEVAANYESDRRRWFTYHRADALAATLAASGFVVETTRHVPAGRGWLSLHARRAA
jgi:SAM-dependent methyltransferase